MQESISNLSEGDIEELCLGSRSIPNSYFGLLESLTVDGCQFSSDVLLPFNLLPFLTNLETLTVQNCKFIKTIFDVKCTTQNRDVTFMGPAVPFSLKKLSLSELPNLKNVWNENPHRIMSMHNLEEIQVEKCERLTCVIPPIVPKDLVELEDLVVEDVLLPFSLLPFLTSLVTFEVNNCDSVKAIFGVKCATQDTITFGLKKLTLYDLPHLENVWNEDPRGILNMKHLQEVYVEQCRGLTNVFPVSIAKDLVKLKNLEVEDCKELMTIVAEDDTDIMGANEDFPCPFVRSLKLKGLPMFKYFYYSSLQCDNFAHLESHTENQVNTKKVRTTLLFLPPEFNVESSVSLVVCHCSI